MFHVYAISSISKNYIYVGMTEDIKSRIERHNKGYEKTVVVSTSLGQVFWGRCFFNYP